MSVWLYGAAGLQVQLVPAFACQLMAVLFDSSASSRPPDFAVSVGPQVSWGSRGQATQQVQAMEKAAK